MRLQQLMQQRRVAKGALGGGGVGHRVWQRRNHRCIAQASSTTTTTSSSSSSSSSSQRPRVVVVGGGWGGLGAALAAAKAGADVTLLDAGRAPGGLAGAVDGGTGQAPGGMELGVKGFWRCYANIDALLAELAADLPPGGVLTPHTRSGFYDQNGLVVEAPVFGDLPRLPAPLGTLVHTAGLFRRDLPLADRLSAAGLVPHLLAHDADAASYARYDAMSAAELFRTAGVSPALLKGFLEPMLLVTLFAPAERLSAAAALGALYYFAIAHQADFDVRWARGPVSSLILSPLVRRLEAMGVKIAYGRRATTVLPAEGAAAPRAGAVVAEVGGGGSGGGSFGSAATETYPADAVVLAAGAAATARIAAASPLLAGARDLTNAGALGACDALAARLVLDRRVRLPFASNVVTGLDAGVGATVFDLTALQDLEYGSGSGWSSSGGGGGGSVVELDAYNAAPLMGLDDDAVVDLVLSRYLPAALGGGGGNDGGSGNPLARAVDVRIARAPRATTLFSPGSEAALLPGAASVRGVFCAGDAVRQGPGSHGAKGLSQEKGYVTGLQAGNAAARMLGLTPRARVLPAEPDEPHVELARSAVRGATLAAEALMAAVGGRGGSV